MNNELLCIFLSNTSHSVLYIGVTNDLIRRVYEHKQHLDKSSFTHMYNAEKLVYFECTNDVESAMAGLIRFYFIISKYIAKSRENTLKIRGILRLASLAQDDINL